MADGRSAVQLVAALEATSSRKDDHLVEEVGMLEQDGRRLAYLMTMPRDRPKRTGVVICHSWFEFKMLQSAEIALARAVALSGFSAIYIQAPGMGDSSGVYSDCTVEARVGTALRAAEELLACGQFPDRVCMFGARMGAAIAARAAQELGPGSSLAMWDPALNSSDYWKQAKRFGRVVATLGPRTKQFATPDESLAATGRASFLGYQVTQEMVDDLQNIDSIVDGPKSTGPALILSLNDQMVSAATRTVSSFVQEVDGVSLGRPKPRHLIHMGVKEAKEAVEATVGWMERRLN